MREALAVIEIVTGLAALFFGGRMLLASRSAGGGSRGRIAVAATLLAALGVALAVSAVLLLTDFSQARLVSLEAGVLFTGWVAAYLTTGRAKGSLPLIGLTLGVVVVVLSLLIPAPG